MTPRVLIAGRDAQQRLWLRHHLQSLWPDADPTGIDLSGLLAQLQDAGAGQHDAIVLCAEFAQGSEEGEEGLHWLRALRRVPAAPPVIVLATHGNELTAVRAIRLGASAYLPRDLLDARRLGGALRLALHTRRRRAQREARRGPSRVRRSVEGEICIPGYTLLRELGSSARASVWLARSDALDRAVALKISTPEHGAGHAEGEGQQFAREYAAIAALRSASVVDIYDYGLHAGREFLAMEYFPCGDLKQRLQHPLRQVQALDYARRIAAALCVTHAAGILHRDLKPPNIMLRADGSVVLIDFGLAKQLDANTHSTAIGVLRGSPYYMSPEQVQALQLDARSDIYSLGVIFYELLTGHKPFHGLTAMELMQKHVTGERPPLPAGLEHFEPVLARLMARERTERYASAGEALAALDALAASSSEPAAPAMAAAEVVHAA